MLRITYYVRDKIGINFKKKFPERPTTVFLSDHRYGIEKFYLERKEPYEVEKKLNKRNENA